MTHLSEIPEQATDRLARRIAAGTREPENWYQLIRFGLVGASGYFINLVVFALANQALGIHHIAAAVIAFCVAVTNNFIFNRHWTFKAADGDAGSQAARFFAVSIGGLGINLAVLYLFVDVLDFAEVPSQALAVAIAMPFNFLGNRLWTFR